jgi:uncharacterized membrane protein YphA (DoxX/SURF4 family)
MTDTRARWKLCARSFLFRWNMKTVALVQRILLGTIFLVHGLAGFLPGHAPSFGTEIAREYMKVMQATPYAHVLFGLQALCGLLLIAGVFVPLALTILAGYLFNIYMFHLFLDPSRSLSTVVVTVLWILTFVRYREAFRMFFRLRSPAA